MVDSHAKNMHVKFYTSNNNNLSQIEVKNNESAHAVHHMSSLKTFEQTVNHFSFNAVTKSFGKF